MNKVKIIRDTIEDLVSNFMYYDRKEDEELPRGSIEKALENKELTVQNIVDRFEECLVGYLK